MGKLSKRQQSLIKSQQELSFYQGPLPSPEQLEKFETTCPGSADRIFKMTESQVAHRQYLERKTIDTQAENSVWGLRFAFVLGMTTVLGGVYVASCGQSWAGFGTVLLGLAALTATFIYGKESNKKELIEKQKLMNQIR